MERIKVKSSNIESLQYDAELRVLSVIFIGGDEYHYKGVPTHMYKTLISADSVGKAFNSLIRNNGDIKSEKITK